MWWGVNILSKFQLPSFYSLGKIGSKRITELMNQSMNDKGVCRTALATPGLLTMAALLFVQATILKSYIKKIMVVSIFPQYNLYFQSLINVKPHNMLWHR